VQLHGWRPFGASINRSAERGARRPKIIGSVTSAARRITAVLKFLRRATREEARAERDPAAEAAAAFWRRWARLRPAVATALDSGEVHLVEARVASAVAMLDHRLGWSLAGGDPDEHHTLVITGEGDERLRPLTDAWLAAAPDDAGWEYHDSAQALDDPADVTLGIGSVQVALADVRVTTLADGDKLHVAVFHPDMARLPGEDRDVLSFVALDTALGERVVERRIGVVEPVLAPPAQALDLMALRELVAAHDRPAA
jgi:hypothetical protein